MIVTIFSYARFLFGAVFLVFHTLVFATLVIVTATMGLDDLTTTLVRTWCKVVLFIFGIRVDAQGEENLPAKGGAIIVFDHQSHFDIPVIASITEKNIRFGAKIELFKIPLFGQAMRAIGTLPIARENRSDVFRVYKEAEKQFARDFMFVLAPEGTRQAEPKIGRFKKGPFLFACNAGVPVVPVVLKGAHEVLPKKALGVNLGAWSRTIHIRVLPPVASKQFSASDLEPFVDAVRNKMVETYEAMPSSDVAH